MRFPAFLLAVTLLLSFAAIPARAQYFFDYENGPVNGQVDGWTINYGFAVTNSFSFPNDDSWINNISFWAWISPGDVVSSVEVSVGSQPFGSDIYDGFVNPTQSFCSNNSFGYEVCLESASFYGPYVTGNAWLTLQNATTLDDGPVYWDENSGVGCQSPGCPSQAQENTVGSIPSEAFTITEQVTLTTTTTTTTALEPGSMILFATGVVAMLSGLRRLWF